MNRRVAMDRVPGFAAVVKARRLELGLTKNAAAARAGVVPDTYRRAEDYGAVTLGNAVRITTALGMALAITPEGCVDITRARNLRRSLSHLGRAA